MNRRLIKFSAGLFLIWLCLALWVFAQPLPEALPGDAIPPPGEPLERRYTTTTVPPETSTTISISPQNVTTIQQAAVEEKKEERNASQSTMLQIKSTINFTYVILTLLFISLLGNLFFYFLLRGAQQTREVSIQALHHLEATREFTARLVDQSRKINEKKESPPELVELPEKTAPIPVIDLSDEV